MSSTFKLNSTVESFRAESMHSRPSTRMGSLAGLCCSFSGLYLLFLSFSAIALQTWSRGGSSGRSSERTALELSGKNWFCDYIKPLKKQPEIDSLISFRSPNRSLSLRICVSPRERKTPEMLSGQAACSSSKSEDFHGHRMDCRFSEPWCQNCIAYNTRTSRIGPNFADQP